MSRKGPCVEGMDASLRYQWVVVEPLESGASTRKLGHRDCALERTDPGPFFLFLLLIQ